MPLTDHKEFTENIAAEAGGHADGEKDPVVHRLPS
jgi:hypothetical protein